MMKRITISLDDELYVSLVDYAADKSKEDLIRLSVSKAIRRLLASELAKLNYFPMDAKRLQQLQLRETMRQREKHSAEMLRE